MALYRAIREHPGIESADTFMELLPPTGWGDVVTRDLRMTATELRGEVRVQFAAAQRSTVLWLAAFSLTTWIAVSASAVLG